LTKIQAGRIHKKGVGKHLVTRKPNIFFVGAAKSGTTALTSYLDQHPDIFAVKEPHYFGRDLVRPNFKLPTLEEYESIFAEAADTAILCDASVFYLYSKTAAQEIKDYNPDARIIIQLRNPLDVLPSHHSQVVFEGGEPITDFEEALAAEKDRREGRRMPDFQWALTLLYMDFVRFSEQAERYLNVFGPENVLIHLYDDFRRDTLGIYRKTLEFIGVDPTFVPEISVVNANKVMRSPKLMRMVREPAPWISVPARMLIPLRLRDIIKDKVRRANTKFVPRDRMTPELKAKLRAELRPEIDRLGALLGRDLSHWYDPEKATKAA